MFPRTALVAITKQLGRSESSIVEDGLCDLERSCNCQFDEHQGTRSNRGDDGTVCTTDVAKNPHCGVESFVSFSPQCLELFRVWAGIDPLLSSQFVRLGVFASAPQKIAFSEGKRGEVAQQEGDENLNESQDFDDSQDFNDATDGIQDRDSNHQKAANNTSSRTTTATSKHDFEVIQQRLSLLSRLLNAFAIVLEHSSLDTASPSTSQSRKTIAQRLLSSCVRSIYRLLQYNDRTWKLQISLARLFASLQTVSIPLSLQFLTEFNFSHIGFQRLTSSISPSIQILRHSLRNNDSLGTSSSDDLLSLGLLGHSTSLSQERRRLCRRHSLRMFCLLLRNFHDDSGNTIKVLETRHLSSRIIRWLKMDDPQDCLATLQCLYVHFFSNNWLSRMIRGRLCSRPDFLLDLVRLQAVYASVTELARSCPTNVIEKEEGDHYVMNGNNHSIKDTPCLPQSKLTPPHQVESVRSRPFPDNNHTPLNSSTSLIQSRVIKTIEMIFKSIFSDGGIPLFSRDDGSGGGLEQSVLEEHLSMAHLLSCQRTVMTTLEGNPTLLLSSFMSQMKLGLTVDCLSPPRLSYCWLRWAQLTLNVLNLGIRAMQDGKLKLKNIVTSGGFGVEEQGKDFVSLDCFASKYCQEGAVVVGACPSLRDKEGKEQQANGKEEAHTGHMMNSNNKQPHPSYSHEYWTSRTSQIRLKEEQENRLLSLVLGGDSKLLTRANLSAAILHKSSDEIVFIGLTLIAKVCESLALVERLLLFSATSDIQTQQSPKQYHPMLLSLLESLKLSVSCRLPEPGTIIQVLQRFGNKKGANKSLPNKTLETMSQQQQIASSGCHGPDCNEYRLSFNSKKVPFEISKTVGNKNDKLLSVERQQATLLNPEQRVQNEAEEEEAKGEVVVNGRKRSRKSLADNSAEMIDESIKKKEARQSDESIKKKEARQSDESIKAQEKQCTKSSKKVVEQPESVASDDEELLLPGLIGMENLGITDKQGVVVVVQNKVEYDLKELMEMFIADGGGKESHLKDCLFIKWIRSITAMFGAIPFISTLSRFDWTRLFDYTSPLSESRNPDSVRRVIAVIEALDLIWGLQCCPNQSDLEDGYSGDMERSFSSSGLMGCHQDGNCCLQHSFSSLELNGYKQHPRGSSDSLAVTTTDNINRGLSSKMDDVKHNKGGNIMVLPLKADGVFKKQKPVFRMEMVKAYLLWLEKVFDLWGYARSEEESGVKKLFRKKRLRKQLVLFCRATIKKFLESTLMFVNCYSGDETDAWMEYLETSSIYGVQLFLAVLRNALLHLTPYARSAIHERGNLAAKSCLSGEGQQNLQDNQKQQELLPSLEQCCQQPFNSSLSIFSIAMIYHWRKELPDGLEPSHRYLQLRHLQYWDKAKPQNASSVSDVALLRVQAAGRVCVNVSNALKAICACKGEGNLLDGAAASATLRSLVSAGKWRNVFVNVRQQQDEESEKFLKLKEFKKDAKGLIRQCYKELRKFSPPKEQCDVAVANLSAAEKGRKRKRTAEQDVEDLTQSSCEDKRRKQARKSFAADYESEELVATTHGLIIKSMLQTLKILGAKIDKNSELLSLIAEELVKQLSTVSVETFLDLVSADDDRSGSAAHFGRNLERLFRLIAAITVEDPFTPYDKRILAKLANTVIEQFERISDLDRRKKENLSSLLSLSTILISFKDRTELWEGGKGDSNKRPWGRRRKKRKTRSELEALLFHSPFLKDQFKLHFPDSTFSSCQTVPDASQTALVRFYSFLYRSQLERRRSLAQQKRERHASEGQLDDEDGCDVQDEDSSMTTIPSFPEAWMADTLLHFYSGSLSDFDQAARLLLQRPFDLCNLPLHRWTHTLYDFRECHLESVKVKSGGHSSNRCGASTTVSSTGQGEAQKETHKTPSDYADSNRVTNNQQSSTSSPGTTNDENSKSETTFLSTCFRWNRNSMVDWLALDPQRVALTMEFFPVNREFCSGGPPTKEDTTTLGCPIGSTGPPPNNDNFSSCLLPPNIAGVQLIDVPGMTRVRTGMDRSTSSWLVYDPATLIPYLAGRLRVAWIVKEEERLHSRNPKFTDGPITHLMEFCEEDDKALAARCRGNVMHDRQDGSRRAEGLELSEVDMAWKEILAQWRVALDVEGVWLRRVASGGALELLILGLAAEDQVIRAAAVEGLGLYRSLVVYAESKAKESAERYQRSRLRTQAIRNIRGRGAKKKRRRAISDKGEERQHEDRFPEEEIKEEMDRIMEEHSDDFDLLIRHPFKELREILTLLEVLRASLEVVEDNVQMKKNNSEEGDEDCCDEDDGQALANIPTALSPLLSAFMVSCVPILLDATHPLYRRLNRFIAGKPSLTHDDVPMFMTLYWSDRPNTLALERSFAAQVIRLSVNYSCSNNNNQSSIMSTWKLISRRHVIPLFLDLSHELHCRELKIDEHNSEGYSGYSQQVNAQHIKFRASVLSCLAKMTCRKSWDDPHLISKYLVVSYGLLDWLDLQLKILVKRIDVGVLGGMEGSGMAMKGGGCIDYKGDEYNNHRGSDNNNNNNNNNNNSSSNNPTSVAALSNILLRLDKLQALFMELEGYTLVLRQLSSHPLLLNMKRQREDKKEEAVVDKKEAVAGSRRATSQGEKNEIGVINGVVESHQLLQRKETAEAAVVALGKDDRKKKRDRRKNEDEDFMLEKKSDRTITAAVVVPCQANDRRDASNQQEKEESHQDRHQSVNHGSVTTRTTDSQAVECPKTTSTSLFTQYSSRYQSKIDSLLTQSSNIVKQLHFFCGTLLTNLTSLQMRRNTNLSSNGDREQSAIEVLLLWRSRLGILVSSTVSSKCG